MHSYQHQIKTFNNATMHLTHVERALYRAAIEMYYDTEQPLPAADFDWLARKLLARSDEEKTALKVVLDEFFVLTGDVYTHDYCDQVIEKYHNTNSAKARAGKASAEARKKKAAENKRSRKQKSTCDEHVLNSVDGVFEQNSTNKNKNKNKKQEINIYSANAFCFDGIDISDEQIQEVIRIRNKNAKTSKAGKLTQRIVSSLVTEFKQGMGIGYTIEQMLDEWESRGWQGFKSAWLKPKQSGPVNGEMPDGIREWLEESNFIDGEFEERPDE